MFTAVSEGKHSTLFIVHYYPPHIWCYGVSILLELHQHSYSELLLIAQHTQYKNTLLVLEVDEL